MGHQQLNMDEYFGWKAGLSEKKPSDDKTGETTGAEEETAQPATVLTQVEDLEEHQLHKIWALMILAPTANHARHTGSFLSWFERWRTSAQRTGGALRGLTKIAAEAP
jgi:hypothetical protein